jgi:hypothetical protein
MVANKSADKNLRARVNETSDDISKLSAGIHSNRTKLKV